VCYQKFWHLACIKQEVRASNTKKASTKHTHDFFAPFAPSVYCPLPGEAGVFGRPKDDAVAAFGQRVLTEGLKALQQYWLKGKPFMTGDSVTIADLLCVCELEQLR
jgi:glutathione S-transferase